MIDTAQHWRQLYLAAEAKNLDRVIEDPSIPSDIVAEALQEKKRLAKRKRAAPQKGSARSRSQVSKPDKKACQNAISTQQKELLTMVASCLASIKSTTQFSQAKTKDLETIYWHLELALCKIERVLTYTTSHFITINDRPEETEQSPMKTIRRIMTAESKDNDLSYDDSVLWIRAIMTHFPDLVAAHDMIHDSSNNKSLIRQASFAIFQFLQFTLTSMLELATCTQSSSNHKDYQDMTSISAQSEKRPSKKSRVQTDIPQRINPREEEQTLLTEELCRILTETLRLLDPHKTASAEILDKFSFLLLQQIGQCLKILIFDSPETKGAGLDTQKMPSSEDENVNMERSKAAKTQEREIEAKAPYLTEILQVLLSIILPSDDIASSATLTDQETVQDEVSVASIPARLQDTLMTSIFGEQYKDTIQPFTRPPIPAFAVADSGSRDSSMIELVSKDPKEVFKDRVWSLIGWQCLYQYTKL